MKALIITLCTLVGCASPLPLRVRDQEHREDLAELPDEVLDACAIFGFECAPSDETWGVITIDLIHVDGWVQGRTLDRPCRPSVWSEPRAERIAHEMGHVLELDDVDVEDNVMHLEARGDALTDRQLRRAERAADRLVGCGGDR